ncbi:alkaline phosphatase family protein, partial [bacterium]|nr:alkaline phosphatase family protein [bacterium]MBU1024809.1 alkaline phosphatase family protein [bacterium]
MIDRRKSGKTDSCKTRKILPHTLLVLFIGILSLMLSGCAGEPSMREDIKQKIIVLGFDGMDSDLTAQFMAEGKLPNFSRLQAQGCFYPLITSTPPESPVSWSSLLTGLNPGKTNIYDFLRRDYEYRILPSWAKITPGQFLFDYLPVKKPKIENMRDGDPIWVISTENGIPTTVFQAPISFPCDGIPGSRMTPGLGVPDAKGTQGTFSFYVDDLEILSKHTKGLAKSGRDTEFGGQTKEIIILPGNTINDYIYGPRNPITMEDIKVEFDVIFDRKKKEATITVQGQEQTIKEKEWSDWWRVTFRV